MGAITEESSSKSKSKEDLVPFSFNYGPSLLLALISFVGCQLSGVASINYYITVRKTSLRKIEKFKQNRKKFDKNNLINKTKELVYFPKKCVIFDKLKKPQEGIYVNVAVNQDGEVVVYEDSQPYEDTSKKTKNSKNMFSRDKNVKLMQKEDFYLVKKRSMQALGAHEDIYRAKKERKEKRNKEKIERQLERKLKVYGGRRHLENNKNFKKSNTKDPTLIKAPSKADNIDRYTDMNEDLSSVLECPFSEHISPTPHDVKMKGLSLFDLRSHHGVLLSCDSLALLLKQHNMSSNSAKKQTIASHHIKNSERLEDKWTIDCKLNKADHALTDFEVSPMKANLRKTISTEPLYTRAIHSFKNLNASDASSYERSPDMVSKDMLFACSDYFIKSKKKITHV